MKFFLASNDSHANDPFKPSQTTATFDDSFEHKTAGFEDDSWHGGSSWNTQTSDPFGGSKPDPFGGSSVTPAKDVS